jgi:hypothetical protein
VRPRLLASGVGAACLLLGAGAVYAHAADPVIAAAGDIACSPNDGNFNGGDGEDGFCRQKHTSDLLVGAGLDRVLALGDVQYASATAEEFQGSYEPSWGRVKSITRPVIGNHEYRIDPDPYWDYFNGAGADNGLAGERGKGYYSFDVGSWHLIALNSQCNVVPGGCGAGSAQEQWLRADLAANPASCTLAYWHHPEFHSGPNENNFDLTPFWEALYDARADLILNGHRHSYERFAPQDPLGNADPQRGLREIIVGTGGHSHALEDGTPAANSVVNDRTRFGVLMLVLHPSSYDWRFVTETGATFDSGSGVCHNAPDEGSPQTRIDSGPAGTTSASSATFSFSSSETDSTFQCRLDGGAWAGCTSPSTRSGLAQGTHSFEVRATDAAGNTDPSPAARVWSVQRDADEPSTASDLFLAQRPMSYEIVKGDVYRRRGKLRRLYRDDERRLELLAAAGHSGRYRSVFKVFTALGADQLFSLRSLRLDFNGGTSRRRAALKVDVFNYRARQWVKVFGPRRGRRDRSFDWSVAAFPDFPDDYLSPKGVFRIRVKAKGPNPFRTRTDLVRLTVGY